VSSPRPAARGPHRHYAWTIVVAALVVEFFGLGFGFFALVASYPYFEQLGWARTTVVASSSILIVVVAVLAPLTGIYMDRRSLRQLFIIGGLTMAVGHALLGFAETPLGFFFAAAVLGVGMAGVTILPNQVLISRWFRSRLGLANGLISAGTVLGGSLSTMVVTVCAESYGRRFAFLVLAALVGTVPPLVGWQVVRDRPEDMGLEPYDEGEPRRDAAFDERTVAIGEVVRQRTFWLIAGGLVLATVPCYTSNKHLILYLRDIGLDATAAAEVKSSFILMAGLGRLLTGIACDRFDRYRVLIVAYVLGAISFPIIFAMPARPALIAYPLLFGLAYGGIMPMMPIMVVECFGLAALGTILGWIKIAYDASAATAPLAAAYVYDRVGNYHMVFVVNWLCAVAAVWCAIALARGRARERRTLAAAEPARAAVGR